MERLPPEIVDLIIDQFAYCRLHRWATPEQPCINWGHTDDRLSKLLPMRLVNRAFNSRLAPMLLNHIICKNSPKRQKNLSHVSRSSMIEHVRVLRIELSPQDLGHRIKRTMRNLPVPVEKKLLHFFEVLSIYLIPVLKRFVRCRTLHVTVMYTGVSHEKWLPKNDMLLRCFESVCKSVKAAEMGELEDLTIGLPYEGGYTNFFEELDDPCYKRMLKESGKNVRSASLKLFDHLNNFTTMPFF